MEKELSVKITEITMNDIHCIQHSKSKKKNLRDFANGNPVPFISI